MALQQLRAVFGYEEEAFRIAAPLYLDALGDLPPDLLAEAVAHTIRMATAEDRFPKPGTLRALVTEQFEGRREAAAQERRQYQRAAEREEWPAWLAALWGPWPEGPRSRRLAIEQRAERQHGASEWRDANPDHLKHSGRPDATAAADAARDALRRVRESLGCTATETTDGSA